jgi:hypothetical protein
MPTCTATWTDHHEKVAHDDHECVYVTSGFHSRHECRCGLWALDGATQ